MGLWLKNLVFTLVVPGTVGVYLPLTIASGRAVTAGASLLPAAVVLGVGIAIYAWCVWDFASFGRGTPAPIDAPKKLVMRGLYRFIRNPMYVGVLILVLGWALLYRCIDLVIYAAVVGLGFHALVVLYEERRLRHLFGREYEIYRDRVPRWLPRVSRGSRS